MTLEQVVIQFSVFVQKNFNLSLMDYATNSADDGFTLLKDDVVECFGCDDLELRGYVKGLAVRIAA